MHDDSDHSKFRQLLESARNGDGDAMRAIRAPKYNVHFTNDATDSRLHIAASQGNVEDVERLLADGVEIDAKDNNGRTALHFAAYGNFREVAEILLSHGADVNAKDSTGRTPLHTDCCGEVTGVLISWGADLGAADEHGVTPLHLAALFGDEITYADLISEGARDNVPAIDGKTALEWYGEELLLSTFLSLGYQEALFHFSGSGEIHKVRAILAKDNNVDVRDEYGNTALHFAASRGDRHMVELLLDSGADANAKNQECGTPLHAAVSSRSDKALDTVRVLLRHSADVNACTVWHRTVLDLAFESSDLRLIELLLNHGANAPQALLRAGSVPVAELLLDHGADIMVREEKSERTVLHVAARNGNLELVKFYISRGAALDARDYHNDTPLSGMLHTGNADVARVLLSHSVRANAQNTQGLNRTDLDALLKIDSDWALRLSNHEKRKRLRRVLHSYRAITG